MSHDTLANPDHGPATALVRLILAAVAALLVPPFLILV